MMLAIIGIVLIVGAVMAYVLVFRRANPALAGNQVRVGSATFTVELATSSLAQARGLSYRPSLLDGHGMLFEFSKPSVQNFWMKDMNFAIDVIWIGPAAAGGQANGGMNGEVVLGFAENAAPQPGVALWNLKIYQSPDGTDKVLEVNAGSVAKAGIKVGDPVRLGI